MSENVEHTHGAIYAARLLNALLDATEGSASGPPLARTEAYELVKGLAQEALDTGTHLRTLAGNDQRITSVLAADALDELFDPSYYLRNIDVAYRRLGLNEHPTA
jgi:adenylosuccinate lyase